MEKYKLIQMNKRKHFLYEDLTWVEAKEYFSKNDVVILPTGSIEQHGPHNPLATDFQIACAFGQEAAKRSGILCLPGIPVGFSREHKEFPGSLWVKSSTFEQYVKEIILSLRHHGAKKVILVCGHGMNRYPLKNLQQELRENEEVYVTIWMGTGGTPEIPGVDWRIEGHGGVSETSLNLFIKPDTVDMDKACDELEARYRHNFGVDKGWTFPEITIDWTETGSYGRATLASAEIGKMLYERAVKSLVELVQYMKEFKVQPIKPYK